MNRKLRNSLAALASSAAMLVLALVAAHPGAPVAPLAASPTLAVRHASQGDVDPAAHARLAALGLRADAAATRAALPAPAPADTAHPDAMDESAARPAKRRARAHRQTLVMPYFSFAPRG
ncbi:MAG TPA: hypothetical protein VEY50_10735 [Lysobacter sp.]|nr:hypothetical protein [Lysobacter sp.]